MKKIIFLGIVIVFLFLAILIIARGNGFGMPNIRQQTNDGGQPTQLNQQFVRGSVIVSVKKGFSQQEVDGALTQLGIGREKDYWVDLEEYVVAHVLVPDGKEQFYIEKLEELPWVENAMVDFTFEIPDCKTEPC